MSKVKGVANRQSKYTGVSWQDNHTKSKNSAIGFWTARVQREGRKLCDKLYSADDERGAARAVDLALLRNGYEPVNGIFEKVVIKGKDLKDAN